MSGRRRPAAGVELTSPDAAFASALFGKSSQLALTVVETSKALRLDPRTIRAMLRSGELAGNQRGHAIRVSRDSVLAWLSGRK